MNELTLTIHLESEHPLSRENIINRLASTLERLSNDCHKLGLQLDYEILSETQYYPSKWTTERQKFAEYLQL